MNFGSIYLISSKIHETTKLKIKKDIKLKWGQRIGLPVADDFDLEDNKLFRLEYRTVSKNVKLYNSLTLFLTHFYIAHNKIISIYDVEEK